MSRQPPETREFVVRYIGEVGRTRQGNAYVECDTDAGTVAFWGKVDMTNIHRLVQTKPPVRVRAPVIHSNWPQHQLWVPEGSAISVQGMPATTAPKIDEPEAPLSVAQSGQAAAMVSADELNQWRRRLLRLLDRLFGAPPPNDGLISRITGFKREGRIPRKTAALMIALAEIRNAAEHPDEMPTPAESEAARHAWKAVAEWARQHGIDVDAL